jgi:hypothetical protein
MRNPRRLQLTIADRVALLLGALSVVAGVVLLFATDDTVWMIVAAGLLGLGGIALVGLLFLLVGESEDRHYRHGSP